ncbi:hypothetical protein FGF1_43000 [Flavobacteriaceae bacterium GF1]
MKSHLWGSLILFAFLSCKTEKNKGDKKVVVEKQIQVVFNPNIHTSHIVELFVWPGEYPTRPMCVAAQNYFEPFKNHPAIKLSDSLLQNEIFYFDELTEILLYMEDFPSTDFKYPLENSPYSDRTGIINKWVKSLSEFYVDANVASFLNENEAFYEGARQEVLKNLPSKDFVNLIEEYYRERKIKYTILPAPEMPTGGAYGYRGIGPYVHTSDGMLIYQVISASLPVEKDSLSNEYHYFGFDNKEFVLRNSYHEFGHAFVNPILAKKGNKALLKKYEHLFTPELQKVMDEQNYDSWFDCVAEHLVRLGEIRLAERSNHKEWAKELRQYHTEELHFIFLPEFESKIKEYEKDDQYKSFEQFLPNLLGELDGFNSEKIKDRIHASEQ